MRNAGSKCPPPPSSGLGPLRILLVFYQWYHVTKDHSYRSDSYYHPCLFMTDFPLRVVRAHSHRTRLGAWQGPISKHPRISYRCQLKRCIIEHHCFSAAQVLKTIVAYDESFSSMATSTLPMSFVKRARSFTFSGPDGSSLASAIAIAVRRRAILEDSAGPCWRPLRDYSLGSRW